MVASEPITVGPPHGIGRPVMVQGWYDLAALHWRYPQAVVQSLLPSGFTVDTFDGSAWIGLIPFQMRRIRVPGLPPFGPLSTFPETNIRTYIVDQAGRRGVWFFSLDITRLVPALVARVTYGLPYCWSAMAIATERDGAASIWRYDSRRRWPRGNASSRFRSGWVAMLAAPELTELDHFLTARWALGSTFGSRLVWARVAHPPWLIHHAEVLECDETLLRAAGLPPPVGPPLARWSPGVEVRIERPRFQTPMVRLAV